MKSQTIPSQPMKKLLFLLLFVSGVALAQPSIIPPTPYAICDDNTDGIAVFNLHNKDAEIVNGNTNLVVSYYLTLADAQAAANAITVSPYYSDSRTISVRADDPSNPTNPAYTSLSLVVNPLPTANQAPNLVLVSSNSNAVFDLTPQSGIILGGQTSANINYYLSQADAQASINPITNPSTYVNLSNPQILFANVTNAVTGCSSITSFYLIVNTIPINQPTPYVVCDDNNDGMAAFNLHTKDAEIVNGNANLIVSYYLTLTDAQIGINPIGQNPYYNIYNPYHETIYVSVIDPADPSHPAFTSLNLVVNPAPNFTIDNTNLCNGAPYATITAVNQGSTGNYTYVWTTPAGIPNPGNVSTFNVSSPGTYSVIITDITSSCTTTLTTTVTALPNVTPTFSFPTTFCEGSLTVLPTTSDNGVTGTWSPAALMVGNNTYNFTPYVGQCAITYSTSITINPLPTANQAPNLIVVDNPYDGVATFDLTSQNASILGGQTGVQVTYFTNVSGGASFLIANPTAYTNTTNPQTIGAQVTNLSTGCTSMMTSFNLIVNDPNNVYIPDANFKAKLIALGVDTNTDGNIQYSEAAAVNTELNVNGSSIADLTGFEAFTNVPILRCTNNNLSTLNLSNLPNLKTLECGFNSNLTTLNLTNLASLDTLRVFSNNLSSLSVNNLTSLKHLDCSYNHITALTVSNLTNLKVLNCASNWLTTIDVTPLTLLEEYNCSMNQLATINVAPLVNLKTLICSNNGIHTLSLSNLPQLEKLDYGNNQSTLLTFSNTPHMKYLYCAGNSLVSLNASVLPLLEELDCSGNHLTSINVTGLVHLYYFTLALNQMTTINVTGLTSLNNFNCSSNQLTSLNVSGLNNLATLTASNNSITTTNLTNLPSLVTAYLDYNQLSSLNLTGSTNVNQLVINNNILNLLTLTGLVHLSWLDCHENQLTAVNFSGLTNLANALCEHNLFSSLDFSGAPAFNNLGCGYNPNLTAINIKNGNPYINTNNLWVDVPSLTFVCADEEELPYLNQIFTQTSNTNVVFNTYCSFVPGGNHNTITGQIKLDANNNGCDASDLPQSMIKVNINDGNTTGATFTDANGNYKFYTQIGSFTVTPEIEHPTWFSFSPTSATIPFVDNNNNTSTQNFCMTTSGIHSDIEVILEPLSPARPGFDATYKIVYRNKGNVTLQDSVNLQYDSNKLQFVNSTPNLSGQVGYLYWNYSNLLPFEERAIYLTLHVNSPTDTPPVNIGDILHFVVSSIPLGLNDETPQDNGAVQLNQTVVGSYDPNIITCLEGDSLSPTEIGNYLHYGIRFENTGNYQAENIVVKDVIDTTKYDIDSIQLLDTSHPVYTRITGNVVEFIFENINLAGSSGTPPVGGHGDVLFKIKSLNSLVAGDFVSKSAKIFFDYNAPIDTNIAQTTYQSLNNSVHQLDASVVVSPNPTSSLININCNSTIKSIELYDVQGRILETAIENDSTVKLDISEQQNGIYFLKITTENGSKVEKIVKE